MAVMFPLDASVTLRDALESDAEAMARALGRNREHLAPWDPIRADGFDTVDGQRQLVQRLRADAEAGTGLPLLLVTEDEVVGAVTLSGVLRGPFDSAHVGYWLDADMQGRGLMTRALEHVLDVARAEMGLHRLQAATLPANERSRRVLTRCGFTEIGVAEGYLKIAGRWQDHVLYQRLLY